MPREIMDLLKKVRVAGQPLRIQRAGPDDADASRGRGQPPHIARGPRPGAGKSNAAGPRKSAFAKPGFPRRDKPRPPRGS
jgi:ATP-dependent RNA helicase DeaD